MTRARQGVLGTKRRRIMASIDPAVNPAPHGDPSGIEVGEATRQRLFEVLHRELAIGSRRALASGVTPQRLAAHLDERTALLRAHLGRPPGTLATGDSADDPA